MWRTKKPRSVRFGAAALGALAIGAFAVGTLAIGRLAIGYLAIYKSSLKSLKIGELTVERLRVSQLEVTDGLTLPAGTSAQLQPQVEELRGEESAYLRRFRHTTALEFKSET